MAFVLHRVKDMVGNEKNAGNQHFLLFTLCFQKSIWSGMPKQEIAGSEALKQKKKKDINTDN